MQHRYLLTPEDLRERPAWAAALRGTAFRPGEVLLSCNTYFSPMHLITADFRLLTLPGRAQRARRGTVAADAAVPAAGAPVQTYSCRRGFDVAVGTVVPLRRALEGLAAAGQ